MGAPVIVWLRPGVGYVADAAASMWRLERALGRPHDCNSSYRDYYVQLGMWRAWQAWVAGTGPRPNHSRALHPDESMHCRGLADDSDDWTTPGYIELAADHGWIRTAADDPTERHHFEYQSWRDNHRNEPAGIGATPFEEDDMTPEQAAQLAAAVENSAEARRMLAVILGAIDASGAEGKLWQTLSGIGENSAEARRMGGVILGAIEPASSESRPAGSGGGVAVVDEGAVARAVADEQDRRARERLG